MATVVLAPPDERHATALRAGGHTVVDDVSTSAETASVVVVARRDAIASALELAVAQPHRVLALVLVDPEDDVEAVRLAAVAAPTLLVAMPGDPHRPIRVAESYWRHIPTSRLIVETPGDARLWDRPDDLVARVDRFLREVGA